MKKSCYKLLAIIIVFVMVGCSNTIIEKSKSGPSVEVVTPKVKISSKAEVDIKGKGFKTGEEINILFTGDDGVKADIGYALDPKPNVSGNGEWITSWKCKDFVKKKLIKPGIYIIEISDSEYNIISKTKVQFLKGDKKKEK